MSYLKLSYNLEKDYINQSEFADAVQKAKEMHEQVEAKTGLGNNFLGWTDLPSKITNEQVAQIKAAAKQISEQAEVLLVIGIGGSYLGARAVISALKGKFNDYAGHEGTPQVIFAGHHMSGEFIAELSSYLKDKDFAINVISKSGTTTEPAVSFRIFYAQLVEKYGKEEAAKRVYATTDKAKGALKTLATQNGFQTFDIPDDIGGRFSVLTPVGLLPIAAAGIDIDLLIKGAKKAQQELSVKDENNVAYQYAAARNMLYASGKTNEIMVNYSSYMYFFAEWWKQLFGESEGKDNKGIMPMSVVYTTDLHSLGQIVQEGRRNIFETVLRFENHKIDVEIPATEDDLDELNYLAGKKLSWVNDQALKATVSAHENGGVPNLVIDIPTRNEDSIGYLIYFFELSCAISGYMLGVNPFNQPGVEAYKSKMFELLGKK
jgi:glucose-6-phosphate isomerase